MFKYLRILWWIIFPPDVEPPGGYKKNKRRSLKWWK